MRPNQALEFLLSSSPSKNYFTFADIPGRSRWTNLGSIFSGNMNRSRVAPLWWCSTRNEKRRLLRKRNIVRFAPWPVWIVWSLRWPRHCFRRDGSHLLCIGYIWILLCTQLQNKGTKHAPCYHHFIQNFLRNSSLTHHQLFEWLRD